MSNLLRIHEDEPKFRAVYWKLWRNEAARTEFGGERESLSGLIHAASNFGNELSEQCLWHIYFNFTKEIKFLALRTAGKCVDRIGKNLLDCFVANGKTASLRNRAAMGGAGCGGWNEKNSLCAFEFNFGPAISKFSISISPESSVYERTLSAAAASPALYSVTVLFHNSVVVFHSYEFAVGEKGRNSIISAFPSSSARWYNLMT